MCGDINMGRALSYVTLVACVLVVLSLGMENKTDLAIKC